MARGRGAYKRDANEKALVGLWRHLGCTWLPMPPSVGFDGILIDADGHVYLVEVKNPGSRWSLTEDEQKVREAVGRERYHIVTTDDEAIALVRKSKNKRR